MDKHAKVYVAGHRGLVGSAIMRRLEADGYKNILTWTHAELDLTDQRAVSEFFERERPEYVFLAAAKVGGIQANNTFPAEFIRVNLAIQTNVIHEAWRSGVRRLLFLGSSCIYPRDCPQPIKEEYLLTGPLEPTNRPYALAKISGIEMCWSYNRQYGTKYLAAMPTNLYGPGDNFDLDKSHVVPALIRKFHLGKLALAGKWDEIAFDEQRNGPIPEYMKRAIGSPSYSAVAHPHVIIWGSGQARREFLYSDDMADACVHLLSLSDGQYMAFLNQQTAPLINIGVGMDLTIRQIAEEVAKVVGFSGDVVFDAERPDGTPRKLLDVSRLEGLGWQARTSFSDGIRVAYEEYRARR